MTFYLPFNPLKGQAFRLYFAPTASASGANILNEVPSGFDYAGISKNGVEFTATVNAPVEITPDSTVSAALSRSRFYVDLTAAEMNADTIIFVTREAATGVGPTTMIIYTTPNELVSIATKDSSVAEKITAIFQYLFFKRTVTASAETLFKDDGSTQIGSNTISDNGTTFTKGKIS